MDFRIGLGQDSHPVKKIRGTKNDNPLILGGVLISKEIKVIAESDGDILIHALCNALNTAIGYGSLSLYATKMCRRGIKDSKEYLKKAVSLIKEKGYRVNNVSIMVETGVIRLEEWKERISQSLAEILEVKKEDIGIAFTSGERLTSFGEGKGIQVLAVVLLSSQKGQPSRNEACDKLRIG